MPNSYDDDSRRKKRLALIGVCSILLVAMVIAVTVGVTFNKDENTLEDNRKHQSSASIKAVETFCEPTQYKKTCIKELNENAGNATDPQELILIAINTTMKHIEEAGSRSLTLLELQKDKRTKLALDQCKELMDYAIVELKSSFQELGKLNYDKMDEALINLKVWLSAAISHEQTCLDGFQETEGDAGAKMRSALQTAIRLTHNGLAVVSELSNFLTDMQFTTSSRRLFSEPEGQSDEGDTEGDNEGEDDNLPRWVEPETRRLLTESEIKPDMVVAQDGSGQFRTITEAVEAFPKSNNKPFIIYIKEGVYKEHIQVNKSMDYMMLVGDGADKTIITGDLGFTDNITTYKTSTVAAVGDHFIAKNLAIENTAGAIKHQAVALRCHSDMAIFFNCTLDGYQDTLYAHSHRQFYRDCTISGTIDFVFGDAASHFQNCTFVVRNPLPNQHCMVTAQGRKDPRQTTGIVLQGCKITAADDYLPFKDVRKSYLGRPWKLYSKTIIMHTYIPAFIQPAGWMEWNATFALDTLYYAEFNNWGPGAKQTSRVTWPGMVLNMTQSEAQAYTPRNFIQGDSWIPATGVPYTSGMLISRAKAEKNEDAAPVDEAPNAAAPKAAAPVTAAPVAAAPVTAAPVAAAPMASAPKAAAPMASAPKAAAPMTSAPLASAPTDAAPKASAPLASAPTDAAPKASAPLASAPTDAAPKASPPLASAPTDAAPRASPPIASAPTDAAPEASPSIATAPTGAATAPLL